MTKKCVVCGKPLTGRQTKYCSVKCRNEDNSKKQSPDLTKLTELMILSQHTNLTLTKSITELSKRIDNLISMFEEAAKNVGDIKAVTKEEVDQIAKELQRVVQQNKDLAEGLLALNAYVRKKNV